MFRLTRGRRLGDRSASVGYSLYFNTPQRPEAKRRWLNLAVKFAMIVRFGRLACGYGLNERALGADRLAGCTHAISNPSDGIHLADKLTIKLQTTDFAE